jgi:hypothetical protein
MQDARGLKTTTSKYQLNLASVHEEVARRQAAALAAGIAIPYVLDGKLVKEYPDGHIEILGPSVDAPEQDVHQIVPAAHRHRLGCSMQAYNRAFKKYR